MKTSMLRLAQTPGRFAAWARAATLDPQQLIGMVDQSGLTGKGGGAFPTHRKMRLMSAQPGARKVLVVNGSEHEPGSLKDRELLAHYPQLVLEGALIMARAVGATQIVVAINRAASTALDAFTAAVDDARGELQGLTVQTTAVPDSYIVGEETALLEVLEGREPLPRKKPPFPIERGLHGLPTLIQNVETVAHLPLLLGVGVDAYRSLGVTLCTFGPEFAHAGVHEVRIGMSLAELIYEVGGGLRDGLRIKAIQTGGPSSGFLLPAQFDLEFDAAVLAQHGASLGCAVLRAYSERECMVRAIAGLTGFFAAGSCGQCPQCRMETQMLDAIMKQTSSGKGSWRLLERVADITKMAQGTGQCGLIKMPVAPVVSGIEYFRDEFAAHIDGTCSLCAPAGAHEEPVPARN